MSLLNNHRAIRWHDLSSCWKLCLITVCIFPPAILFGCASAILFVLPRAARNVTTMTTYNSENDEGSLIAACVFACIGITIILGICTCIIGNRKIKKVKKFPENGYLTYRIQQVDLYFKLSMIVAELELFICDNVTFKK